MSETAVVGYIVRVADKASALKKSSELANAAVPSVPPSLISLPVVVSNTAIFPSTATAGPTTSPETSPPSPKPTKPMASPLV